MKADYIKLSSKGVEATGRYVPHAIWSYLLLRILGWAVWSILLLGAGGVGCGLGGAGLAAGVPVNRTARRGDSVRMTTSVEFDRRRSRPVGLWNMAVYTFYPCKPDGTSPMFESADLPSDDVAMARASVLLGQHHMASHVAIWQADRRVALIERAPILETP